jgi:hypothetical protein
MATILVAYQIRMVFETAIIFAGSLETHISLNGQMAPLNLNGMAKGM